MIVNQKPTGTADSMPAGIAMGGCVSIISTLACAAILALLVDKSIIGQPSVGYGILLILLLSAFLGAQTANTKIKRRRLQVSLAVGAVYFTVLLAITALFFGGQYQSVWQTALLVAAGSLVSALIEKGDNKHSKHAKQKMRNR